MDQRAVVKIIVDDIASILGALNDFEVAGHGDLQALKDEEINDPIFPFRYTLENLKEIVLSELTGIPTSQAALRAINLLLVACAQPDTVSTRLNLIATAQGIKTQAQKAAHAISNAWSSFVQKIQSIIQSISTALWSLVSNYLNLKEWSVKGTISTPIITSLFGISGSAELCDAANRPKNGLWLIQALAAGWRNNHE